MTIWVSVPAYTYQRTGDNTMKFNDLNNLDAPFEILGFNNGRYYYTDMTGHVVSISHVGHTRKKLLSLASLDYWSERFPSPRGIAWETAGRLTMQACAAKGPISDEGIQAKREEYWRRVNEELAAKR